MKTVVVYESIFGNTKNVAVAIANGLGGEGENGVLVLEVSEADYGLLRDVELLVVGGPTHMFGMSRPSSRRSAKKGVREWLADLPRADKNVVAAAFDTSVRGKWWLPLGSAARGIAARLKARGYKLAVKPEKFYVTGTEGPLEDGELERADKWGQALKSLFLGRPVTGQATVKA